MNRDLDGGGRAAVETASAPAGIAPAALPRRRTRRRALAKLYWRLQRRLAPGVEYSQHAYVRAVTAHVGDDTRWLDLGCGHQLWPSWIGDQARTAARASLLVGLDPDHDSLRRNRIVRHRVRGLELPFRDESFTLVTANMVFEHLEQPDRLLTEIRRVLRPGGVCIVHTPNARYWQIALGRYFPQSLKNVLIRMSEGREADDVFPTHYRVNTEPVIRRLAADAGLRVDDLTLLNTSSTGRIFLLGPFVLLDLLWVRLTESPRLRQCRSNIIAVLRNGY